MNCCGRLHLLPCLEHLVYALLSNENYNGLHKRRAIAWDALQTDPCQSASLENVHNRHIVWGINNVQGTPRVPQSAAATTTGMSSLTLMSTVLQSGGHCNWNHPAVWTNAPQPQDLDVSKYTSTRGAGRGSIKVPFQSCNKRCHHCRSALVTALRRIKWWGALAILSSVNSYCRNVLPGQITVAAWDKWPMRESSSSLEHDFLDHNAFSSACSHVNLSRGSLSS